MPNETERKALNELLGRMVETQSGYEDVAGSADLLKDLIQNHPGEVIIINDRGESIALNPSDGLEQALHQEEGKWIDAWEKERQSEINPGQERSVSVQEEVRLDALETYKLHQKEMDGQLKKVRDRYMQEHALDENTLQAKCQQALEALENGRLIVQTPVKDGNEKGWCIAKKDGMLGMEDLEEMEQLQAPQRVEKPSLWKRFLSLFTKRYDEEFKRYETYQKELAAYEKEKKAYDAIAGVVNERQGKENSAARRKDVDRQLQERKETTAQMTESNRSLLERLHSVRVYGNLVEGIRDQPQMKDVESVAAQQLMAAIINGVKKEDGLEKNTQYLREVFGDAPLSEETKRKLAENLVNIEETGISHSSLGTFHNLLLDPKQDPQITILGSDLLCNLGEDEIVRRAKLKHMPSVLKGDIEYARLSEEAIRARVQEGEKAMQKPNAKADPQNVRAILLADLVDFNRTLLDGDVQLSQKGNLLYTPALRKLGKDGRSGLHKEMDALIEKNGAFKLEGGYRSAQLVTNRSGSLLKELAEGVRKQENTVGNSAPVQEKKQPVAGRK